MPRNQWQPLMVRIGHGLVPERLVPPVSFSNGIEASFRRHTIAKVRFKTGERFGERS